ncbi:MULTISPECIES: hypothetical protein [unclassified Pedobacter]|uniref:hypothetical protein n=1 Tax=unclassified Pedobacter TaxID=2628915 RepID=UPI001E4EDF8F|nr:MULTISPECIES: hypothetical protein [unclassified Pedobacter]
MINDTTLSNFTQIQFIGILMILFGFMLFALVLRRQLLKRQVQGISKFVTTDRTSFSKRSENALQRIGILLALSGILIITVDALSQYEKPIENQTTQLIDI